MADSGHGIETLAVPGLGLGTVTCFEHDDETFADSVGDDGPHLG